MKNPFTGVETSVVSFEPDFPEAEQTSPLPRKQVVPIAGDYQAYLEARLPPFVRARPHWATKGLTEIELRPLVEAARLEWVGVPPLYPPPGTNAELVVLPEAFGRWSPPDIDRHARGWAAAMSTPQHTHSVTGHRIHEGWSFEDAAACVRKFVGLAERADAAERTYLLIEY